MGYYTNQQGMVTFSRAVEGAALQALKDLNLRHDLKEGGRYPSNGDPFDDVWFSWMPSRYHEDESITEVRHILEMLGYEVDETSHDGFITLHLSYDNKTGQEDLFLNVLADFAKIDIHVTGEDGEAWRWINTGVGGTLYMVPKEYVDGSKIEVGEYLRERKARLDRIAARYA